MASRSLLRLATRSPLSNEWRVPTLSPCAKNYGTRQESKPWRQRPNRKARLAIVLKQDVPNLGSVGQIVKVKHGYGRNYLLPQGKAVYATPENIELYDAKEVQARGQVGLDPVQFLTDFLGSRVLTVQMEPEGVFEQNVSKALRKRFQLHVPLDCIELDEPIRTVGTHSVNIRLDDSTLVSVSVDVVQKPEKVHRRKQKEENETETVQSTT